MDSADKLVLKQIEQIYQDPDKELFEKLNEICKLIIGQIATRADSPEKQEFIDGAKKHLGRLVEDCRKYLNHE